MAQYHILQTFPHTYMDHKQGTQALALLDGRGMGEMMRGLVWVMDIVPWGFGLGLLPSVQVSRVHYATIIIPVHV